MARESSIKIGDMFDMLTVIDRVDDYIAPNGKHHPRWLCECSCEEHNKVIRVSSVLKNGHFHSCGCYSEPPKNLVGMVFGKLTVVEKSDDYIKPSGEHIPMWKCKCECGNECVKNQYNLLEGYTHSCGCLRIENAVKAHIKHGEAHDRLYNVWSNIKKRCYDTEVPDYKNYGARGIKVCDEWINSYENFRDWALKNGYQSDAPRGEYTIERIDVNGNYCPENCTWANMKEQGNNKRNNRIITINDTSLTVPQWAECMGVTPRLIHCRLHRGWSEYDAVMIPKGGRIK